jgi:hypothetical protein
MAPQRIIPPAQALRKLVEQGMTHQDIADHVFRTTGTRVTRGAVSAAISRANLSKPGNRYEDCLPWTVKVEHAKHYAARMLRLLGRRMSDGSLSDEEIRRLDSWLTKLRDEHAVVAYAPDTSEGFFYVDRVDGDSGEIPIRRQTVLVNNA